MARSCLVANHDEVCVNTRYGGTVFSQRKEDIGLSGGSGGWSISWLMM